MLPRHRRRPYLSGVEPRRRPQMLVRVLGGIVLIAVVWYGASAVFGLFDQSISKKTSVLLEERSTVDVQVALQDGDWQSGETNLKLYAGDAVATKADGDAVLWFFDGTGVRLDSNTDVMIVTSDRKTEGESMILLQVRSGRIWVKTPSKETYSGAVVRSVQNGNFTAVIPEGSQVLISSDGLVVVESWGPGVSTVFETDDRPSIFVGEGQYLSLEGSAMTEIKAGEDPYAFRDPVTSQLLKDPFLVRSILVLGEPPKIAVNTGSGSVATNAEPLTLTSPENRAEITSGTVKVSGTVSDRIDSVTVNGQEVSVKSDRSFSVDVSIGKTPTFVVSVEARDAQGIALGSQERTVINRHEVTVEPPRIKSPGGSGETVTVRSTVVEVTGEAPPGTAAIIVNDYRLQLFKSGDKTWSYLANAKYGNLLPGENRFTVIAEDAEGNRSAPRTVIVIYETDEVVTGSGSSSSQTSSTPPLLQNPPLEPGTLSVRLPTPGTSAETSDPELSIIGDTSPSTYSISVNGYTLSLYEPGSLSWKYIASVELTTMKRGRNVYRIVSRNKNGEILDILEYVMTFAP